VNNSALKAAEGGVAFYATGWMAPALHMYTAIEPAGGLSYNFQYEG
jgi:hypothetical protein